MRYTRWLCCGCVFVLAGCGDDAAPTVDSGPAAMDAGGNDDAGRGDAGASDAGFVAMDAGPDSAFVAMDAGASDGGLVAMDAGASDAGLVAMDAGRDAAIAADAMCPPAALREAGDTCGAAIDAGIDAASSCATGTADCDMNGSCETNTTNDRNHCGGCGRSCGDAPYLSCASSTCQCDGPFVLMYELGVPRCVTYSSDPRNCGAPGTACFGYEYCAGALCQCRPGLERTGSGGGCRDLQTDPTNCGSAGNDCSTMGTMVTCRGGTCQDACLVGQTNCSNACVDTDVDPMHCGSCTNACASNQVCVSGACQSYLPALGCATCPCAAGCGAGTTCCTYGFNTICVAGSTCPTVMP